MWWVREEDEEEVVVVVGGGNGGGAEKAGGWGWRWSLPWPCSMMDALLCSGLHKSGAERKGMTLTC